MKRSQIQSQRVKRQLNCAGVLRRRSCLCTECGPHSKKLTLVNETIPGFQTYFQLIDKHTQQQQKLMQLKLIKMRSKRHMMQKNSQSSRKGNLTHQQSMKCLITKEDTITTTTNRNTSPRLQKQMSMSPYKPKRKTMLQMSPIKRSVGLSHFRGVRPFGDYYNALIDQVITGKLKARQQLSQSVDDFEVNKRCDQLLEQDPSQQPKSRFLEPLIQVDVEEEEEQPPTLSQLLITNNTQKNRTVSRSKDSYKAILKFHKTSLKNVIQQSSLQLNKSIKNLMTPFQQTPQLHPNSSQFTDITKKYYVSPTSPQKKSLLPPVRHKRNFTIGQLVIKI